MIDAATAELIHNGSAPPTLTDGQIRAEMILYEMEEDRFFLEFPDVAAARKNKLQNKGVVTTPGKKDFWFSSFVEEKILQAA